MNCAACGRPLRATARYCGACGAAVSTDSEPSALQAALRALRLEAPLAGTRDRLLAGPGPARTGFWTEHPRIEAALRQPGMVAVDAASLPALELLIVGLSATQLLSQREREQILQFRPLCAGELALVVVGLEGLEEEDQRELRHRIERFALRLGGNGGWGTPSEGMVLLTPAMLPERQAAAEVRARSLRGWATAVAAFLDSLPEVPAQLDGRVLAELSLAQDEAQATLREELLDLRRVLPIALAKIPVERLAVEAPLLLEDAMRRLCQTLNDQLRKSLNPSAVTVAAAVPHLAHRRPLDPRVMLLAAGGLGALLLGAGLLIPLTGGASLVGAWAVRQSQQARYEATTRQELAVAVENWLDEAGAQLGATLTARVEEVRQRMQRFSALDPVVLAHCRRLVADVRDHAPMAPGAAE